MLIRPNANVKAEPGGHQLPIFRRDFSESLHATRPLSVVFEVQHGFFRITFYEVFKMGASLSKQTDIASQEINNLGAICRRQCSGKRAI